MDRLTTEHRSWNMSRIRSCNTRPEKTVRSMLHRMGYRFRLHSADLPGRPDIILPKHRTVVFVHGCFWHQHESCKYAYTPSTRNEFWKEKFKKTAERDKKNQSDLTVLNWKVVIVWECELRDPASLQKKLLKTLS